MNMKWLDTHTQFDGEPSGGGEGAGTVGDVGGDAGPPTPPSNVTETGAEAAPVPVETPAAPAEAEPGPVAFNSQLHNVFNPVPPPPTGTPPPAATPTHPGQPPATSPQPPTAEEWQMEPETAARKQNEYTQFMIQQGVAEAKKPVEEMRRAQMAEKQIAFNAAAGKAKEAMEHNWETVLNRDREFRANKDLQELTSQYMGQYIAGALNNGSVEDLQFISTAKFARRSLAMAKADLEDAKSFAVQPGGPMPVGPQNQKPPAAPLIDDETARGLDEASDWLGRKVTAEEIVKTREELDKLDF